MEEDFQAMAGGDGVSIHSGFPNPATDRRRHLDQALALDLNQLIVKRPASTYLFKITGHNFSDQGIYDGDIAVIDRAAGAGPNDLVVVWQDNSFNLVRHHRLSEYAHWGVVTSLIRKFK